MKRLKLFEEFINEDSLHKVYLTVKRSAGHRWWTFKGFAGDNFFIQITEENIDKIKINPEYPVLNYNSEITNQLIKNGRIKEENVYNKSQYLKLSGSKEEFHKLVGEDDNVPLTVYSKKEALKLKFPIIAKPAKGHSGLGIQIFKDKESFNDVDESKFNTYSEFIDKAEEQRFFTFKGEPIFWMERNPLNDKAKGKGGNTEEQMNFAYKLKDVNSIPEDYKKVLSKFSKMFEKLPFMCFDMMKAKDGKIYIIEPNTQPGVPFDSTVILYKKIYEDFYNRNLDKVSAKKLEEFSEVLNKRTLELDKKRFSIKK